MGEVWKIPEKWTWTEMGEVAEIAGGGTPPTTDKANFEDGTIPWITPADLSGFSAKYIHKGSRNITEKGLAASSARVIPSGSVLFTSRAPIGYVAIAANSVSTNQGFKSFILSNGIEPEFVYFFLKRGKQLAIDLSSGTTFPEISGRQTAKIPFPLPPLPEQNRIVAAIESYLSRLDDAIASLEKVERNLKRYRASVLKAAVEGRLVPTEAEKYFEEINWKPLETAILSLDQGWSPKCENKPSEDESTWGVIKTTAVQSLSYCEWENKQLPDSLSPRPHLEIKPGDIIITRAGPRNRVGVCCLVKQTRKKLMLCDKTYRLRSDFTKIGSRYLELVLNSPQIVKKINELKTGISDSGVNLTQVGFKALKIPIPPLNSQHAIENEVERLWSITLAAGHAAKTNLARARRLRQSILKWAFEGKLVDQDPNDEPASVLLERIKAERAARAAEKARGGGIGRTAKVRGAKRRGERAR